MQFGSIIFKCTNCGHTFKGPNIEYNATIFSAPVKCPHCNSMKTLPNTILARTLYNSVYKKIWDSMKNN